MASAKKDRKVVTNKKKTYNGQSARTKYGSPGPNGGNKKYKKRYKGQGR
jgi:hypothetical protein